MVDEVEYIVGANIPEEISSCPDWEVFGFNSPEEYQQHKQFNRMFNQDWEEAQYEDIADWNYDCE